MWLMKKFSFIIILIVLLVNSSAAQQPIGWVSKFGLAVGVTPTFIMPNIKPLNQFLPSLGLNKLPESGVFGFGGGGYAYILVIDNVRIGGLGFGGSVSEDASIGGITNEVKYSTGAGALTIEYTLPFIKKIAVSVGTMIGKGYREIEIYQNNKNFTWDEILAEFDNSTTNISRRLENDFFTITPTLNIDYPLNRFIAFRLGAGYLVSLSDKWTAANAQDVSGVPEDLNQNSFFIQTGIFIGFFAL
jgi:hypothetical protein